jgi:predicted heme/steroid binding protein
MRHGLSQLGMIAESGCTKHLFSKIAWVSMMLTWEDGTHAKSLSAGYGLLSTKQQLATQ